MVTMVLSRHGFRNIPAQESDEKIGQRRQALETTEVDKRLSHLPARQRNLLIVPRLNRLVCDAKAITAPPTMLFAEEMFVAKFLSEDEDGQGSRL
jgi:hypothetical protein